MEAISDVYKIHIPMADPFPWQPLMLSVKKCSDAVCPFETVAFGYSAIL